MSWFLSQFDNEKERAPQYSLKNVDFNAVTRVAHIEILQRHEYRTIERYVTRNYEKYPIYSYWKVKEKIIKKTIKLTNRELETLHQNSDALIKMFAAEIISWLNDEDLFPSWYKINCLNKELNAYLKMFSDELSVFIENQNIKINEYQKNICVYDDANSLFTKKLNKKEKIKNEILFKLKKIMSAKKNFFKSFFSLGVYNYLKSNKRKNKIESVLLKIEQEISKIKKDIADNDKEINKCNLLINERKLAISEKEQEQEKKVRNKKNEYDNKLLKVKPLASVVVEDKSFRLLKYFSGLDYEQIIGVYIIHNKEKDKYYVGQSKDVLKRLKQHFNGTVPKNMIFAEDYYTSHYENKDNLFEVKIIRCSTKDELDRLEKQLIHEYDSWKNGYNGTSGNL